MKKLIAIETTRYSKFFKRILSKYNQDIEIIIDGKKYESKDINHLLEEWCTNTNIKKTRDFILKKENEEIVGFHDDPNETWMILSEENFIKELAREEIIRYKILPVK